MRTLSVGCDASGKSTFVQAVHEMYGDSAVESTSTNRSRTFKQANLSTPIDSSYIDEREQIYLELTSDVMSKIKNSKDVSYIGTDASLVTRLSHDAMRLCIGEGNVDYERILNLWLEEEKNLGLSPPNIVALTYAPFALIESRIRQRQQQGDELEKFWGFNSLFFLEQYQQHWLNMTEVIGRAGIVCLCFDTSIETSESITNKYAAVRKQL